MVTLKGMVSNSCACVEYELNESRIQFGVSCGA